MHDCYTIIQCHALISNNWLKLCLFMHSQMKKIWSRIALVIVRTCMIRNTILFFLHPAFAITHDETTNIQQSESIAKITCESS